MPFARPTLTDLRTQAMQDITASDLPNADGFLRKSVLRVLAWVMAGLAYLQYGYLDWISRESVPFTATDEYLEAWAALVGVYRKDASPASGTVAFTGSVGSPTSPTVMPAGTVLARTDGASFTTTADATVQPDGTLTALATADAPGEAGNTLAGATMNVSNPVAGINATGTVADPFLGGADQETDDALRTRMLFTWANPPQGGDQGDYIIWATAVAGVTRAWVVPSGMGPGSVVVYIMLDVANASNGGLPIGTNGCATKETRGPPATGDQLRVADAIYPEQPVTALVYVCAPLPHAIDVEIGNLSPSSSDLQAEITDSLRDILITRGEINGVVYPSDLYEAVSAVPGIDHFVLLNPTGAIAMGAGELPVLGTVSFV